MEYTKGEVVHFHHNDEVITGTIATVDRFGQGVSYDIATINMLYKHIDESDIIEPTKKNIYDLVDSGIAPGDKELLEKYLTIKIALDEYGHTENIVNAYISCANEIVLRYFDEKGLIDRQARKELIESLMK